MPSEGRGRVLLFQAHTEPCKSSQLCCSWLVLTEVPVEGDLDACSVKSGRCIGPIAQFDALLHAAVLTDEEVVGHPRPYALQVLVVEPIGHTYTSPGYSIAVNDDVLDTIGRALEARRPAVKAALSYGIKDLQ